MLLREMLLEKSMPMEPLPTMLTDEEAEPRVLVAMFLEADMALEAFVADLTVVLVDPLVTSNVTFVAFV